MDNANELANRREITCCLVLNSMTDVLHCPSSTDGRLSLSSVPLLDLIRLSALTTRRFARPNGFLYHSKTVRQ